MADRKTVVQVKFRLRRELLKEIERSAKSADRSTNEEIEFRLEESFRKEDAIRQSKIVAAEAARQAVVQFLAQSKNTAGHAEAAATTVYPITESKKD
jgi:hypothetical protein